MASDVKKAGYTPGPWRVSDQTEIRETRRPGGFFIASTYALPGGPMVDEDVPQRQANARLIAAAPELLDELCAVEQMLGQLKVAMVKATELGATRIDIGDLSQLASSYLVRVRTVIAKSESRA